jgi:hypothetical protein
MSGILHGARNDEATGVKPDVPPANRRRGTN